MLAWCDPGEILKFGQANGTHVVVFFQFFTRGVSVTSQYGQVLTQRGQFIRVQIFQTQPDTSVQRIHRKLPLTCMKSDKVTINPNREESTVKFTANKSKETEDGCNSSCCTFKDHLSPDALRRFQELEAEVR